MTLLPLLARGAGALLVFPVLTFSQGSLSPVGDPAPSMRTLEQLGQQLDDVQQRTDHRIPLRAPTVAAVAGSVITIDLPGSYVLAENLKVPSGLNGIAITAPGVTLDLGGFGLFGRSGARAGIVVAVSPSDGSHDIEIGNGTISGFTGAAVETGAPVDGLVLSDIRISEAGQGVVLAGSEHVVRRLQIRKTGAPAIGLPGSRSVAEACVVTEITGTAFAGGDRGISAALVRDCVVDGAIVSVNFTGIRGGEVAGCQVLSLRSDGSSSVTGISGGTVRDCLVSGCGATSGGVGGIDATMVVDSRVFSLWGGAGVMGISGLEGVRGCSVSSINALSSSSTVHGIRGAVVADSSVSEVSSGAKTTVGIWGGNVSGCRVRSLSATSPASVSVGVDLYGGGTARANNVVAAGDYGFRIGGSGCSVVENVIVSPSQAGIWLGAAAVGCRLEGNLVTTGNSVAYGIWVEGKGNLIVGNRCAGSFNTAAYAIGTGNRFGPIITSYAPDGEITTANPWANFAEPTSIEAGRNAP